MFSFAEPVLPIIDTSERATAADCSPLVTIITAVRNGEKSLEKCLESVICQDYPNVEHIVIDGGSTDGTLAILAKYGERLAFWISEPDEGVYDAWNKGLSHARGEWIAFLGADDTYLPGAIRTYIDLADRNPQAEFLSSTAQLKHVSGHAPIFGGPWKWPEFTRAMTTIHVGTFHRKSMFSRLGIFNKQYRIAGDYEFMLRAGKELKTAFTPITTVVMQAGGVSDSTAGIYEAERAKLQHAVRHPLPARTDRIFLTIRFYLRKSYLAARTALIRGR